MAIRLYLATSLSFILFCLPVRGQGCEYRFVEEPVVNLTCNPYNINEIRPSCAVRAPSLDFTIHWFWQNSSGEITGITSAQTTPIQNGKRDQLRIRNLSSHKGLYWCQVKLSNGTVLEGSSRLTLLDEDFYVEQRIDNCSTFGDLRLRQSVNRCIFPLSTTDNPPFPTIMEPSTTTSPSFTTTMALNQTSPSNPEVLGPALYAVIAVILVFCLVIITLTVVIVLLYRRKCARVDFKTAESNHYSNGFTKENPRLYGVSTRTSNDRPSSLTSSTNSTRPHLLSTTSPAPPTTSSSSPQESTEEEPYSRLVRSHSSTQSQHSSVVTGYSKISVGEDTPPPRPPKPVSPQTSLVASTSSQQRVSRIYGDLDDQDLDKVASGEFPLQEVPHTTVYNSPEGPRCISSRRATHPDYDPVVPIKRRASENSNSTSSAIFDDPEYYPLQGNKQFEVTDRRYTGSYERSPEYTCPIVRQTAEEIDPKYRGNYERDPNYIPKPPPRRASDNSNQHTAVSTEPETRRQNNEVVPLSKYRGNYERSPNYVPSPLRAVENDQSLVDRKYSGNYERDPVYMANLTKKAKEERASSSEHSRPRTSSSSKDSSLVSSRGYVNVNQGSGKFSDSVYAAESPDEGAPIQYSTLVNKDNTVVSSHSYVNVEQGSDKFSQSAVHVTEYPEDSESLQQGTFMDI